ncbi:MAG: peptide chain release factor N(5)-glutamine methyltransferase [Desulfobulbaceae bacterium]|nr:peptide chain release factor N(5)-glutamine methyltransferase [Desulfobulbaceae bacterium]
MSVKELLQSGTIELEQAGVVEACNDARILLENCLGKSRTELFLSADSAVKSDKQVQYRQLIARRKLREPVAYILGQCEFWSLPFYVTPDVLIPRPETEFLLDRVLSLTKGENIASGKILDLCCGSGVIAIVLAKETGERIVALDISTGALHVAKRNAHYNDVVSGIDFVQADLFSGLLMKREFSLIVSNPPYVSRFDVDNTLEPEVASFEPHLALDGGDQGLEVIQKIRYMLPLVLKPGGEVYIEIGADQGADVVALFREKVKNQPQFEMVEILLDYAGRNRVLHGVLSR